MIADAREHLRVSGPATDAGVLILEPRGYLPVWRTSSSSGGTLDTHFTFCQPAYTAMPGWKDDTYVVTVWRRGSTPVLLEEFLTHVGSADDQVSALPDDWWLPASITVGPSDEFLRTALHRLAELQRLPNDWDSYGAQRPTRQAIRIAAALLLSVAERLVDHGKAVELVEISAVPDGGVFLAWARGAFEAQVRIQGTGALDVLFVDLRGKEPVYDERHGVTDWEAVEQVFQVLGGD